jgi:hypothetical protein
VFCRVVIGHRCLHVCRRRCRGRSVTVAVVVSLHAEEKEALHRLSAAYATVGDAEAKLRKLQGEDVSVFEANPALVPLKDVCLEKDIAT